MDLFLEFFSFLRSLGEGLDFRVSIFFLGSFLGEDEVFGRYC